MSPNGLMPQTERLSSPSARALPRRETRWCQSRLCAVRDHEIRRGQEQAYREMATSRGQDPDILLVRAAQVRRL